MTSELPTAGDLPVRLASTLSPVVERTPFMSGELAASTLAPVMPTPLNLNCGPLNAEAAKASGSVFWTTSLSPTK